MGDIIGVGKSDVEIDVNINAGIGESALIFNGRELTNPSAIQK